MKAQNFFSVVSRRFVAGQQSFTAIILLVAAFGCMEPHSALRAAPPAAECINTNALFDLLESAPYSREDKEALKAGLSVAIPFAGTNEASMDYVSQETIDIQIKKSPRDFSAALALVFAVDKCLEQKAAEFMSSKTFQGFGNEDRKMVAAYVGRITEQYRGRALETLFDHYGRAVSVPAGVTRSIANPEYTYLLVLAAKSYKHAESTAKHVVKIGDSLAYIARLYKVSYEAILAANPGLIPTRMRAGQVIVIPPIPRGDASKDLAAAKETVPFSAH